MKDLSFFNRIYLATAPVDFRKQAHGLALIVEYTLGHAGLNDKVLFAFTNKRRTAVKILYWDVTGYALWWKTLEKDRFRWPADASECQKLEVRELRWLLDGVDLGKLKKHERVTLN